MEAPKKIVVYSIPTCPHCKRAKQFLEDRGVPFQAVDVAADKAGREEMIKKSGKMSVPVIEIDGVVIVGFDETRLKEQLGL